MFHITCEEKLPDRNANQNQKIYIITCTLHDQIENQDAHNNAPFQQDNAFQLINYQNENENFIIQEPYVIPETLDEDNKMTPCKWENKPTKFLLAYLKENNEKVLQLESRGIIANEVRNALWNGASAMLREHNYTYSANQCATKWKNIKQNYHVILFSLIKNV
ncbi:2130_t:CDS:2 [Funneliformis geosporum]|nr:2130_t:CDS:2 [Funneliformis geosporum]